MVWKLKYCDLYSRALYWSLKSYIGDLGDYSTEIMGSSLGASFFKETIIALILAFILMGFVVFLYFKTII